MNNYTGDDLLNTFKSLDIDLRNLSPNVIKAWFDTDCKDTQQLLNWMCFSLSDVNYVPPLERAEFEKLNALDSNKCVEEIVNLNRSYLSILDSDQTLEEIMLIQDEIDLLEEENKTLDKLLNAYENMDGNFSLDLTHKTQKEIKSKVECKKSQEACADLSAGLDETNKKLQKRLVEYDPDAHFVNFVNVKDYLEIIDDLNSFLLPLMEIDQTSLDHPDDYFSEALETCRKRILHSQQIYLANKVELEKLSEILEFLNTANINESMLSWSSLKSHTKFEAKEMYKKRMCDVLDDIASKFAEYHLKLTKIRFVEEELQNYQKKSQNLSMVLENLTKFLSYYTLTNCLQIEEKKDVECVNSFYQKMVKYVNEDLFKCTSRINQMNNVIDEHKTYLSRAPHEKVKLVTAIAKVLNSDGYELESVLEAVGRFKAEMDFLERQVFSVGVRNEKEKAQKIKDNIRVLENFLISGPTHTVVIVPIDLQNVWFEIEDHLKRESLSVGQAVQIPQNTRKLLTKAQNYTRQLWMNFLTNPSKLDTILKQAEDDFKSRTAHYF